MMRRDGRLSGAQSALPCLSGIIAGPVPEGNRVFELVSHNNAGEA